jgi:hypothetical protein
MPAVEDEFGGSCLLVGAEPWHGNEERCECVHLCCRKEVFILSVSHLSQFLSTSASDPPPTGEDPSEYELYTQHGIHTLSCSQSLFTDITEIDTEPSLLLGGLAGTGISITCIEGPGFIGVYWESNNRPAGGALAC